ncbi:MAG: hypothetical protein AAGF88_07880 [Pseudomonadota bacterium]
MPRAPYNRKDFVHNLKECRWCKADIHEDAGVCNHCQRDQRAWLNFLPLLLSALGLITAILFPLYLVEIREFLRTPRTPATDLMAVNAYDDENDQVVLVLRNAGDAAAQLHARMTCVLRQPQRVTDTTYRLILRAEDTTVAEATRNTPTTAIELRIVQIEKIDGRDTATQDAANDALPSVYENVLGRGFTHIDTDGAVTMDCQMAERQLDGQEMSNAAGVLGLALRLGRQGDVSMP